MTASAPAAALQWADQTATDLELTIEPQTTPAQPVNVINPAQGLAFTVTVHGKPATTSDVQQPIGMVRLYWASSATDTSGAEIPVTPGAAPIGVYWNSSQLHAVLEQFPAPPAGATYVRVKIDAPVSVDADSTNSSRYLRIESSPTTIRQVPPQFTTQDTPTDSIPIELLLGDPNGDASQWVVTAEAADPSLVPPGNLQVSGTGAVRSLVITPATGRTGRTFITVSATSADNRQTLAPVTFRLCIALEGDDDLDGVPNAVEAAAPHGGDGNRDGLSDQRQAEVASLPSHENGKYVTLVSAGGPGLLNVHADGNPSPNDAPATVQFPLGFVDFVVDNGTQATSATVTVYVDPTTPLNTFYRYGSTPERQEPHWYPFLFDGQTGATIFADRIELHLVDGQRGDDDGLQNGWIEAPGAPGFTGYPWQNPALPCDVDNDGFVQAVDVLLVINALNADGSRTLPVVPEGTGQLPPFLDAVGDNFLKPNDVLTVINYINSYARGEGEAAALAVPEADGGGRPLGDRLSADTQPLASGDVTGAAPFPSVPRTGWGDPGKSVSRERRVGAFVPLGLAVDRGDSPLERRSLRAAAAEFDGAFADVEAILPDIAEPVAHGWGLPRGQA